MNNTNSYVVYEICTLVSLLQILIKVFIFFLFKMVIRLLRHLKGDLSNKVKTDLITIKYMASTHIICLNNF